MRTGDLVVYRMNKESNCPGKRAKNVRPTTKGETYSYQVDKFWVVVEARRDGTLEVATRRNKRRIIQATDHQLRLARWWERWFLGHRFPKMPASESAQPAA